MNPLILVVDDDDQLREILQRALTLSGFRVVTAENGSVALQRCAEEVPDVVLTDIVMPEREGLETIMELRRRHPGLKIIAMSGGGRGGSGRYLDVARRLGAAHTLIKPFSTDELLTGLRAVLGPGGP